MIAASPRRCKTPIADERVSRASDGDLADVVAEAARAFRDRGNEATARVLTEAAVVKDEGEGEDEGEDEDEGEEVAS